ncbi:hypothetical protein N3K66_002947 [Trichothecium roseum]|uniref:Uncharacterized protein n=1 Tax=Trichothecium roseum TaxID=47278 RepID=A0ACC0V5E8_9HYPO|nr:hypothetical protein N3K66_002947 [Trichothecium roseum]
MEEREEDKVITLDSLSKHNTETDCWIAVHQKVWDITDFVAEHPGGSAVLLRCAGSNATKVFDSVHAPDIIEQLPKEKLMGSLLLPQPAGPDDDAPVVQDGSETQVGGQAQVGSINNNTSTPPTTTPTMPISPPAADPATPPPLSSILSSPDLTLAASAHLAPKTWAFYSSAATDLVTHGKNRELVRRVMLRPRVLRDVAAVDTSRTILGSRSAAPFFVSPAAMARLVHPDGELAISRGVANEGIFQCISSNASYTLKSIISAAPPDHPFFLQLYVNSDRAKTTALLRQARSLGVRAVFVTVDAPVPGKREADERAAQATALRSSISGGEISGGDRKGSGLGRLMARYIDKSLVWGDLAWIREASGGLPVVLKGVQTADDVVKAVEFGVDGVLLSNHGGRSLDGSQASILVLLELRKQCPWVFGKLEVYIDGGFERGSDILKAIALGATAVGIGRPYLYSLLYGQEGVQHLTQILKDELETSMRLLGITSLDQATSKLVNTRDIDYLVTEAGEEDVLAKPVKRESKL